MLLFSGGFFFVTNIWKGDHSEFSVEKAYEYLKKYGMGIEWKKCQVLSMTAYNTNNRKKWAGFVWIDNNFHKNSFLDFSIRKSGDVLVYPISGDDSYWDTEGREKGLPQTTLLPIFQYCRRLGFDLNKVHRIEWIMRDHSWFLSGLDIKIPETELLSGKSKN